MRAFALAALTAVTLCLFGGVASAGDSIPAPVFLQQPVKVQPLKFAAPVFDCPNCTQCANGCNCFGGGYYCADGSCPIQFGAQQQFVQVCENGKCRLVPINGANNMASGPQPFSFASGGCASGNCGMSFAYPQSFGGTCATGSCGTTGAYSGGGCATGSCGAAPARRGLFGGGGLFGRRCR